MTTLDRVDRHTALTPAIARLSSRLRADLEGIDKVDDTVKRPLQRALANLIDALSGMGLARFAKCLDGAADSALDPIELKSGSDLHSEACSLELRWLEAYVRFDGWDWIYVEESESPAS